jgi:hypothetical protein
LSIRVVMEATEEAAATAGTAVAVEVSRCVTTEPG